MISKTPDDLAEVPQGSAAEPFLGPHSALEQWLDDLPNHWSETSKEIRSVEPTLVFDRPRLKQLRLGVDDHLRTQLNPLIKQVANLAEDEQSLEQLVVIAESALVTLKSKDSNCLSAISMLLAATRLRRVAISGSEAQFQRLLGCLLSAITSAEEIGSESPLLYQWLSIELPLRVAAELFALKPFRDEAKISLLRFVGHTREQMDSDAWPGSSILNQFAPLAASWVRCIDLVEACDLELDQSFLAQIGWLGEQFVRFHGPKKQLLFSGDPPLTSKKSLVEFILRTDSDGRATQVAKSAGLVRGAKQESTVDGVPFVEPSCVSEWSKSAILRSSWDSGGTLVGVDFSSSDCVLEVAAKARLLSGICPVEVRDNGQRVDFGDEGFEVVCQMIDDEIAYVELEILREDYKFYRQVLLSKQDRFLFFADSIHKDEAGEIDYRLRLPLAKGIDVICENGTRELYLNRPGKGIQSLVLPLALPEWSAERCRGRLSVEHDHLCLEKMVEIGEDGGALYCPVFIDLDPQRSRLKRTWRSLTVAEGLEIVDPRVAGAFRVQVDEDQYVFYRALHSIGNRTFMGQNFAGDFYAAKFFRSGEVNELVSVQ